MPYTALQTLGWLAHHSKWERAFNVNQAFLQHAQSLPGERCGIVVGAKKNNGRRGGMDGKNEKREQGLVVVFKAAASPGKRMRKIGCRRKCKKGAKEAAKMKTTLPRGHGGCSDLDCKVCGTLWEMWCWELEGKPGKLARRIPDVEEGEQSVEDHGNCVGVETCVAGSRQRGS